jgi:hypothetical protein
MRNFIPFTSDAEVIAIGAGLMDRTLPKSNWSHAAHFAATLWLLKCHPEIDPFLAIPKLIRGYNEATGVANTDDSGYHETITQASIRAARAFLADRPHARLFEVCNELMRSPLGDSEWLLTFWSRSRLFAREARSSWTEPDRELLPF